MRALKPGGRVWQVDRGVEECLLFERSVLGGARGGIWPVLGPVYSHLQQRFCRLCCSGALPRLALASLDRYVDMVAQVIHTPLEGSVCRE